MFVFCFARLLFEMELGLNCIDDKKKQTLQVTGWFEEPTARVYTIVSTQFHLLSHYCLHTTHFSWPTTFNCIRHYPTSLKLSQRSSVLSSILISSTIPTNYDIYILLYTPIFVYVLTRDSAKKAYRIQLPVCCCMLSSAIPALSSNQPSIFSICPCILWLCLF